MKYLRLLAFPIIWAMGLFERWTEREANKYDEEVKKNDNGYLWG